MRRTRRSIGRSSKAAAEPEADVIDLVGEDDGDGLIEPSVPAGAAPPATANGATATAAAAQRNARPEMYDMEYAFPSDGLDDTLSGKTAEESDSDWLDEQPTKQLQRAAATKSKQPAVKKTAAQRKQQQLQNSEGEGDVQEVISQVVSKRTGSSKRPASTATVAAAADADVEQQPPSKRAKPAAKASSRAAAANGKATAVGRKGSAGRSAAASGKQTKQTTLQSKGFGALFFSASQPASGQTSLQLMASGSQGTSTAAAAASQPEAPAASAETAIQWVDKHAPACVDELVVHKRKVAEVQAWLQVYMDARAAGYCPTRVLLVTGPTGCGKSATVRVLAASMGFELTEWQAPVPTLWQDYQYQAGAGVGYSSKLDEFDLFVTRCKFAALPLLCSTTSKQQQQQSTLSQSQQQQPSIQSQPQQQMPPPKRRLPQVLPYQQQEQQGSQQQQTQSQQQPLQSHDMQLQPSAQQEQQPSKQQRRQPRPKLLLVDDLPYVNDNARRAKLAASLSDLASSARCPVVVIATTEEGGSSGSSSRGGGYSNYGAAAAGITTKGLHKDLLAVLERAGATSINFNPITNITVTKALQRIAVEEGFALDTAVAEGIAHAAAGDLRNAIQSLQMLLLQNPQPLAAHAGKKGKAKAPRQPRKAAKDPAAVAAAVAAAEAAKQKVAGQVARDQHLSVYHAIGKLLHYKRGQPVEDGQQQQGSQQQQSGSQQQQHHQDSDVEIIDDHAGGALQQHNRLWRPRLHINPEAIIQGSGLEALQVTAFLAENYPHFFADDAMEEAATAALYLSDAGYLASHRSSVASSSSGFWDEDDTAATTLQASAASSIAARGLLFANTQPAPSRWLPLKGPTCFLADRAAAGNLQRLGQAVQLLQDSWQAAGLAKQQAVVGLAAQLLHSGPQERAAQVLPFLQVLARQHSRVWVQSMLPQSWYHVWNGAVTEGQGNGQLQSPHVTAALQAAVAVALMHRQDGKDSIQQGELADSRAAESSDEIETDED